ncbi:Tyrosine recombinase XerC [Pelotomaculum schinkii]|uniref:Tyrosine recombinase XerC n=1 Tax=Pelotomaculum schinkii TaxID=78350 RepID=A0A4Y7R7R1_9FIRM|nr:tyrosine-type recombinase/integrase [Pelotomaculum schinkii]TEB04681.1 Tyrosine recombinase XerC [Pelotomaculum schinkii]
MENTSGNILNEFFEEIYSEGAARSTVEAYRKDLTYFFKWYEEVNDQLQDPEQITSIDLREYQNFLQNEKELKPATINRRMAALEKYLKWVKQAGYISRLPNFPKTIREQKVPPKSLGRTEQNRLLREAEKRCNTRDFALLRLLMSCGLRVSEAVAIRLMDLDIGERHGQVIVRGKGNKWREVPIPPDARKALREWLAYRELLPAYTNSPWLFPSRNGEYISARYAEQVVKNLGQFAGLNIHPHILRHTAATNMIRSGADLVTVAQVLGHSNLNTTAIYTKPGNYSVNHVAVAGAINL